MITTVIERWYVQMAYNSKNSPAYVDMVEDMRELGDGVFTATFKINDGNISDYVTIKSEHYVDTTTPAGH